MVESMGFSGYFKCRDTVYSLEKRSGVEDNRLARLSIVCKSDRLDLIST